MIHKYNAMSNLKADATKELVDSLCPDNDVCFEDFLESDKIDIYDLLNLSALRNEDDLEKKKAYHEQLVKLCESNLKVVGEDPMAFSWAVDGEPYVSTSLLYELYMTTLSLAEKSFLSTNNYRACLHLLTECKNMLKKWNTVELIYPNPPYKCTKEYIDNMLTLTRASMLLSKPEKSGNALSTAMNFAGSVSFHIPQFSDTALNHYLIARTLLYSHVATKKKVEDSEQANEAYTAAKEALACCKLIDRSKCHIDTTLDTQLNRVLEEMPPFIENMEQVYYSVELTLESIRLPTSVSLQA